MSTSRDVRGVEKRSRIVNHIVAHVVGPFENLGTIVDKKKRLSTTDLGS
jgi:hypothetical protein